MSYFSLFQAKSDNKPLTTKAAVAAAGTTGTVAAAASLTTAPAEVGLAFDVNQCSADICFVFILVREVQPD